jgi:DNA-binding PucR family transcriptional regulator
MEMVVVPNEHASFELDCDTLEELADAISEQLACSVTIEDVDHKLLAYSYHPEDSDPARISTIVGRKVPERIVQALWREGIFQQLMKSARPVRVAPIAEVGLGDRVAAAIRKGDLILGYIWIAEVNERLDEGGMDFLVQAAKVAAAFLKERQLKSADEARGRRDFFWKMLSGQFRAESEIREAARTYRLPLPAHFSVYVLQFPEEIPEQAGQHFRTMIPSVLGRRAILHLLNYDQLILLEDCTPGRFPEDAEDFFAVLAGPLRQRFGLAPAAGGSGAVYDRYVQVENSYQEAMTVIRLKRTFPENLRGVHRYSELGFYRLLPLLAKDHAEYGHPGLVKLEKYDQKHNGNLLPTLEAYLNCDCRMKETADALHIHENTLSYRLKRIAEIGGINLNSMDERTSCYLEIRIRQFAEDGKGG